MNARDIVNRLIEQDGLDPKEYVERNLPSATEQAIQWALQELQKRISSGDFQSGQRADEAAGELATDACVKFGLPLDAWEAVVTPLFSYTAETFP